MPITVFFFFSSRRRHTRLTCDWSSDVCSSDLAGMYSMAKTYDERELSPIFEDPTGVIAEVLGHEPSPELLSRLLARRGRRSMTEQPSIERRERAMERPL